MDRSARVLSYDGLAASLYNKKPLPFYLTSSIQIVDDRPQDCDFEVSQLMKVMWTKIRTHAPEAYHVISRMTFTQDQYEDLLRLYVGVNPHYATSDLKLEEAACQWVRHNGHVWHKWMPENHMTKKRIYLGGMFPLMGPHWRQPGIVPGTLCRSAHIFYSPPFLCRLFSGFQ